MEQKSEIEGEISASRSRINNDFGQGFYTGESYDQAVSFVSGFERSSVYYLDFDESELKCKRYKVDQEWMLTIAYYRGTLEEYREHPIVRKLIKEARNCDYIIAPIAIMAVFYEVRLSVFRTIYRNVKPHSRRNEVYFIK